MPRVFSIEKIRDIGITAHIDASPEAETSFRYGAALSF